MSFTAHDGVDLVKALAWPITALVGLGVLRTPVAELIRSIGRRATKFSMFKVEVELAKMSPARESLELTVEGLRKAVVGESGLAPIAAGITRSGAADYVVVALGPDADKEWLTSRLFLLAAILERSRVVRSIVFTGELDTFIGAATPRDVRATLGAKFPEYERALFAAYGAAPAFPLTEFRGGEPSETVIHAVAQGFLSLSDIKVWGPPPPPPRVDWVYLDGSSTWELAHWVTAQGLRSLLGDRLYRGGVFASSGTVVSEEITREIVGQSGPFVALLGTTGVFEGLCDRGMIVDKLAREAAVEAGSI
jgi:hypothetical protein